MCYFFHKPRIEIEYYSVAYFEWITEFDALLHWASAEGGAHTQCVNAWTSDTIGFPQIHPPFCNLSLSTKCRGGLYVGCDNFSCDYALPSGKAWSHCLWWGPSTRRRDAPDASSRLTSFSVEGRGSRALPRSSWRVHRWCGRRVVRVRGRHFNSRQPSGFSTVGWVFFWVGGGGGLCAGYTSARLCSKNAVWAYAQGGAYLWDTTVHLWSACEPHRS